MAAKRELTITEVARMGGKARHANLSTEERSAEAIALNAERWAKLSLEQRRAQTAAARAAREENVRKRASKRRKRKGLRRQK